MNGQCKTPLHLGVLPGRQASREYSLFFLAKKRRRKEKSYKLCGSASLREYFFRLSKKESLEQASREYSFFLAKERRRKEKSYNLCGSAPAFRR